MPDTNSVLNKILFTIGITLGLLLSSACSTKKSTVLFTPPAAEPDQAIVYIYRPSAMTNALYSPGLNINGEFKLYTKNGMNSRLSLEPGEHSFEFQTEKKYSDLIPVKLTLDAGTINYIRVDTSLEIKNTAGYEPYARSFKLTPVEAKLAEKEIAECCLDSNTKSAEETKTVLPQEDTNGGFSVDKTQNPFSH